MGQAKVRRLSLVVSQSDDPDGRLSEPEETLAKSCLSTDYRRQEIESKPGSVRVPTGRSASEPGRKQNAIDEENGTA